jgi:hypothetical protein
MEKLDAGRKYKKCTEKCARMHNFLCMMEAHGTWIGYPPVSLSAGTDRQGFWVKPDGVGTKNLQRRRG